MTKPVLSALAVLVAGAATLSVPVSSAPVVAGQSDLDGFMQKVVARRDENWKKLQQYVLDETRAGAGARALPAADLGRQARVHLVHQRGVFRPQPAQGQRRHDLGTRSAQVRRELSSPGEGARQARAGADQECRGQSRWQRGSGRTRAGRAARQPRRISCTDPSAAVHRLGVFPEVQVRAGQIRARRPRDPRWAGRAPHRVLPGAALLERT